MAETEKVQKNNLFLPAANTTAEPVAESSIIANSLCPCCGYITIPNGGDALAYICPVCFWEIDLFIRSEQEPSDLNHGLTLTQARQNYAVCGAVLPRLKKYCRKPTADETPPNF